ncbi:Gfo/Idh/MocA family protein [Chloroflexota bacterium]
MKEPLKIAIVGCGRIGQWHHIQTILKMREAKLVAICEKNIHLAKEIAQRFNIIRYYVDYAEMLNKEEVDMVDICTPPQTHFALSIQALQVGCHVLVEKPIALNVKEVDELAGIAKKNNVKLCQVHNKLFEPVMIKACAMVKEGKIGDLTGIDIQVLQSHASTNFKLSDREHWCHNLPAGILTETLPHPIYLAAAFLGKLEPVAIHTEKSSNYDWVLADEIRIVLKGRKGMGTVSYSHSSPKSKTIIDVHGTRSHLRIDLMNSALTAYGAGTETRFSRALENLNQSFSLLASSLYTTLSVMSRNFHNGHYTLIQRFVESIQRDTEPPVTLQEARDVIEVIEKVTAQI